MASKDKGKRNARKGKQRIAKRYTKAREDAQLAGVIETSPAGAVHNEQVDPSSQGSQPLVGLVGRAVRNGWATPDEKKPEIVDELVGIVTTHGDGMVEDHVRVSAARTLAQIDQIQWERDNPELAGKAKGGTKVNISNEINNQVNLLDLARQANGRADPMEEAKREVQDGRETEAEVVGGEHRGPGDEGASGTGSDPGGA